MENINLIPLTEIYVTSSSYVGGEIADVLQGHGLREVYVNPNHVIMIREDLKYKRKLNDGELVDGLDKRASFTELYIDGPSSTPIKFTVVGHPEIIIQNLNEVKK